MKLFLMLFFVIIIFIEVAVGWKAIIDRFDIKYINDKRLKVLNATVFKYNRTTKAVSFEIEIFYDLHPELTVEIKMYGFMSNQYRLLPFVLSRKVCDILKLEFQWLKHNMKCNFIDTCPVPKGRYYLKDYSVDVSRFPKKPWSMNNYMLQARVYFKKEEEVLLHIYVMTTDDDEYVV